MKIQFIGDKTGDFLRHHLNAAERVDIAVAYLKNSGMEQLSSLLPKKMTRLLVGRDFYLTEPNALRRVLDSKIPCKLYRSRNVQGEGTYHPKVYIFRRDGHVTVIVGSSNLTKGGLYDNLEASLLMEGNENEDPIPEVLKFFESQWTSSAAEPLTSSRIDDYQRVYDQMKKERLKTVEDDFAVIVCHTKEHDANNVYDRLVGVPDSEAAKKPYPWVRKGTRIYMYYKKSPDCSQPGIYVVVQATDQPYYDDSMVPEWSDAWPKEKFPHRIDTEPLGRHKIPVTRSDLTRLRIRNRDTGSIFSVFHLMATVCPISTTDARKIDQLLRRKNIK